MESSERFGQIEQLLAQMLRKQDQHSDILNSHTEILKNQTEILKSHSDKLDKVVSTYNTGFDAMLRKMDDFTNELRGLRKDFQKFADYEDRLTKLEEAVFRKGA